MKGMYDISNLMCGYAYLELFGNLYEYIGDKDGKHLFQNLNDDSHIELNREELLNDNKNRIIHRNYCQI